MVLGDFMGKTQFQNSALRAAKKIVDVDREREREREREGVIVRKQS